MFKVICHTCNAIIYESQELQPLEIILQTVNYQCPKCHRRIDNPTPKAILANGKRLKFGDTPKPKADLKKKAKKELWWRKEVKK